MGRVRVGVIGAIFATLLPLTGAPSTTVEAAPDDIVSIVIEGTGNGHGRGMSQWGAYGYAVDHGWQWGAILDHYYGGTISGTVDGGQRIRVRLTALDGYSTVGVVSHGAPIEWNGLTSTSMYATETAPGTFEIYGSAAHACPSATTLTVPDGPLSIAPTTYKSTVRDFQQFLYIFHDSEIDVDGYFGPQTQGILQSWQVAEALPADGVWDLDDATRAREIIAADPGTAFTLLGTETTAPGDPVTFTSADGENSALAPGQAIGVCRSDNTITHYRGSIDVLSISSGNRVVNDVKVDDYLRGVVPKEISASWANAGGGAGANAVRAQAVAARSYGLEQTRSYYYDGSSVRYATTCDTTSCQVYGGAAKRPSATGTVSSVEHVLTDAAIAATANVVRRWPNGHPNAGEIVSTEFSASNGPRTAGGAFPPVDDIGDDTANNPNHTWTRVIDADELEARYGLGQLTDATMVEAADAQYQQFDGIWFNDIVLTGTNDTERIQAWNFRNTFGLPSPGFTVDVIRADPAGQSFAFIGDSVGNSISQGVTEFQQLLAAYASATVDAVDSRCTTRLSCPGLSGVQVAENLPYGTDVVLVELGYNDIAAMFPGDIAAMMTALTDRGVDHVVWVNMADIRPGSSGGTYTSYNAALETAAVTWPNLTVLDWNGASDHPEARAGWFIDGVHLTSTGRTEFARFLRDGMLLPEPDLRLVPPKRIVLPIVGETLTGIDGEPVVVPADATAVTLNITAFLPVGPGYVTVWPCSATQPETSNLNYVEGDVIANNVIAPIAADGTICLYSKATTDLIVDVSGWMTGDGSSPGDMVGVTAERVVDTRDGTGWPTRLTPSDPIVIDIAGMTAKLPNGDDVVAPVDVSAVSLNVTAVDPLSVGYLTIWPCAAEMPLAASVNFAAGETAGNGVLADLDAAGQVCIYSNTTTDVVVDVQGWFGPSGPGHVFTGSTPRRIVDTRFGTGVPQARVPGSTSIEIPIHGVELEIDGIETVVPETATAAVVNVVTFLPDQTGYATVWPCEGAPPLAANLVYSGGDVVANGVIAPIGSDGTICLFTLSTADVIIDMSGWLSDSESGGFTGAVPKRFVDTRYGVGPVPS